LIEEQLKILKFMTEMTGHVDMNEFASKTGFTSTQIMQDMQSLSKEGFLKKVGSGFTITEKGKNAIKAVAALPANERFNFYFAVDQPTSVSAGSISEFYDGIEKVNAASLEFHLERGDFENWFRTAIGETGMADEFVKMKKAGLKCEDLRKTIAKALEGRYSLKG
jgi:predicted transcriptional regulator